MSRKGNISLWRYFLNSSPRREHHKMMAILALPQFQRYSSYEIQSNNQYLSSFLNGLEVVGPSTALLTSRKYLFSQKLQEITGDLPSMYCWGGTRRNEFTTQEEQLKDNIDYVNKMKFGGSPLYQQLGDRLKIAPIALIRKYKKKLQFLDKTLDVRRLKLKNDDLQMKSNMELSQCINDALSKVRGRKTKSLSKQSYKENKIKKNMKEGENKSKIEESEETMMRLSEITYTPAEQLKLGQQYLKSGMQEIALNYFKGITKDTSAPIETQMQAAQLICREHELQNNVEQLKCLLLELEGDASQQVLDCLRSSLLKLGEKSKK